MFRKIKSLPLLLTVYSIIAISLYQLALKKTATLPTINETLKTVDLITFSFDRPMQLEALLKSIDLNLVGIASSTVIYRTSNDIFAQAYEQLKQKFPHINFIQQGKNPNHDFKQLVLNAFRAGKSPYICFAVDDIIVKNKTDLTIATDALATIPDAYGFFLRLGTHLTYCYSENKAQPTPPCIAIQDNIYAWTFKDAKLDWGFANTVDMTIYRKKELIQHFITMTYTNPNKLEGIWSHYAQEQRNKKGLCFTNSVIVNIPTNLVQDVCMNRHMNAWSPEALLEKFNEGLKIDIDPLQGIKNESCHINYSLTFTAR